MRHSTLLGLTGFLALMTMLPAQAELLVGGSQSHSVPRFDISNCSLIDVFVSSGSGGLSDPNGMAFGPDRHLYVSSAGTESVLRYDGTTGAFIDVFVSPNSGGLDVSRGLVFGPDGHLYVASALTDNVLRYDGSSGAFIDEFVSAAANGGLIDPYDLEFGPDGRLYVSDQVNNAVRRYDGISGAFVDVFVTPPSGGLSDLFNLAFGADGHLYLSGRSSDLSSWEVFRYDGTSGAPLPAAGRPGAVFSSGVTITIPADLAFGPDGRLYVADFLGDNVRRFDETTGIWIDDCVASQAGGLNGSRFLLFRPPPAVLDAPPASRVKDINPSGDSLIDLMIATDDLLFFTAEDLTADRELWVSDGTETGTRRVTDINTLASSNPADFAVVGQCDLVFSADDGLNGRELWASDGTEEGTVMVRNINLQGSSDPQELTAVDEGVVVFSAVDDSGDREPWISDGTLPGTVLLGDLNELTSSDPLHFEVIGPCDFVFSADDGVNGRELWISDGTELGTLMLADINPGGSSNPVPLTIVDGTLYLSADDGVNGRELWATDGTAEGTIMIEDINPTGSSNPDNCAVVGQCDLVFSADDGVNGRELWITDGTAEGTIMIEDINPTGDGDPTELRTLNGRVVFNADDGSSGLEPWVTDGTPEGTLPLGDLSPAGDSDPRSLTAVAGWLIFTADDAVAAASRQTGGAGAEVNRELWITDGTAEGTKRLQDLNDAGSSSPDLLTTLGGGALFFSADDGLAGRELWARIPLTLRWSSPTQLSWNTVPDATSYDVVRGDLRTLRGETGDFGPAIEECLADDEVSTTTDHFADPDPGEGFWYLTRWMTAEGLGTWDNGSAFQATPRDASIGGAPGRCP